MSKKKVTPVKVFVYGTLRPTRHSAGWAYAAEIAPPRPAHVPSGIMWSSGYPWVAFVDVPTLRELGHSELAPLLSPIVGDVLTFNADHPSYHRMRDVELGAGYLEKQVSVEYTDDGSRETVIAWDVSHRLDLMVQRTKGNGYIDHVPSGDWFDYTYGR